MNYYNENDTQAAAWMRDLIAQGHLPAGDVDERSIEDVRPDELMGYRQCHFFAGIGGWSYALRLAGWPDDRPVWTGSCPCQPFSAAGARKGTDDERHLWPAFRWLIDQCRPAAVLGEQVASKAGRVWLAGVRTDLEAMGYAVGTADLCAAGVGAPHIRQRLWWVADAERYATEQGRAPDQSTESPRAQSTRASVQSGRRSLRSGMGHSQQQGLEGYTGNERDGDQPGRQRPASPGPTTPTSGDCFWSNALWTTCADGKARRIEPGIEPLAHGVSGRVGLLRGYGNAIVPQVAAEFIKSYMEL